MANNFKITLDDDKTCDNGQTCGCETTCKSDNFYSRVQEALLEIEAEMDAEARAEALEDLNVTVNILSQAVSDLSRASAILAEMTEFLMDEVA